MQSSLKVVGVTIAPSDTDFGIARIVELSDGSGRIEVFDKASKSWVPSPKGLTVGDVSDGRAVSSALAARLRLSRFPPIDLDQGFSPEGLKQRDKMVALGYDKRALIPSSVNGMPVYDGELDVFLNGLKLIRRSLGEPESPSEEEAEAAIREARGLPAIERSPFAAPKVLQPASLKALRGQPMSVQNVVDRWASGSPTKVKEMEANGTLLERAIEQAAIERKALADARMCGANSDVPDFEILAANEIPALPE